MPRIVHRFGGHAHAVGCTLPAERIPELRARLDAYARERLTPEDFVPVLAYDSEISLDDVNDKLWQSLQKLEPFGSGNPTPVFVARNARLVQPAKILKEKHIKMRVVSANPPPNGRFQQARDVLGWRMGERASQDSLLVGDVLDLAFTIEYNQHPDFGGVQLNLADFTRAVPLDAGRAAAG